MLGGGITVTNQPGRGSMFTLKVAPGDLSGVPLIEPNQNIVVRQDAAPPLAPLAGRILVVDDRRDIRELVRNYIENAGGQVVTAEDGQAALDRVEVESGAGQCPFDLIVMDMQMPVLDGFQAVAILRARGFKKPIIALTAGAMLGEREKCLEIGCDDYLSKPIDGRYLIEMISRHLQRVTPAHPPPVPNTTAAADTPPVRHGLRVLLVEDNANARDATAGLLSHAGHDVDSAADGRSAIARARQRTPDVVLLDIGLPDMDGYAVLRELKTLPGTRDTMFIALSGSGEDEHDSDDGFDHYIVKPAGLNDLLALFPSAQA
jgi:two-component system CheB/CheR fusion protein